MGLRRGKVLGSLLAYVLLTAVFGLGSWSAASAVSLSSFDFIFGSIVIATGGIGLGCLIILIFQKLSKMLAISISLVAFLAALGAIAIPWVFTHRDYVKHKEYLDVAHSACTGCGVDWAASYTEDQKFHPAVIADRNILGYRRWSYYNDILPVSWRPELVSDIQLVVCVDRSEQDLIQSCEYRVSDGREPSNWVIRVQHVLSMRLVNAETGVTIQAMELRGSLPKECPSYTVEPHAEYKGKPVPTTAVIRWLSKYVVEP